MFAKVYSQIFASSIAENYTTRHVFMDMLVLADSEGVVDMTLSAISRTTNVPIEIVEAAIKELSEPDKSSRSPLEDGRRIALVDSHREWGWRIINYDHYRSLRDEEARRSFNRNYMRDYREKKKPVRDVKKCKSPSTSVDSGKALSTHAEGEGEAEEVKTPVVPKGTGKVPTSPQSIRISKFMGRRETTEWSDREVKAFKAIKFNEEDLAIVERYYLSERNKPDNICRTSIQTLLNNWPGEVDRANSWAARKIASNGTASKCREV